MKIELSESPPKSALDIISQGIESFNQGHMPDEVVFESDTRFAVIARNNEGEVLGGVRACAFWNYCIIELLWLQNEARGGGVGSKLVAEAEAYAKSKGFQYMRTETLDFQAKPFYEKLGYKVFGELPNHPAGHTTCLLTKVL